MAPRKPQEKNHKATTPNASTTSTGAGVVKRLYPKVRFHEDGLLNVERKTGKYFKMAQQNQRQSPLLRLAAELRNKIFAYALGGKTFRIGSTWPDVEKVENETKYKNALALLQVCRQIYAETTLLPFRMNIFSVTWGSDFEQWTKSLHPARAQSITWVTLDLRWYLFIGELYDGYRSDIDKLLFSETFKHIHVTLFVPKWEGLSTAVAEEIRKKIMELRKEMKDGISIVWE